MNRQHFAFLPVCVAASVVLGGCLGSESGDEEEVMTEAEPTAEDAAAITWSQPAYSALPGARVRFSHNGDYVEICDTKTDGMYAIAYYSGIYVHTGGHPTACKIVSNQNPGFDLPEGIPVRFNVCVGANQYCKLSPYFWNG